MSRSVKPVVIAGYEIGENKPPFIIAEMSGNHNQSLDRAMEIVDAAADAGVHAVKIQTYTPDTMTLDISEGPFLKTDPDSPWHGKTLYEIYQEAYTPWEWHKEIFERCKSRGLVGFSTPFDATAVEYLEELNVPCYKISSFENTDLPLISKVAETGKPVLISTGMATRDELEQAVFTVRDAGCDKLILLKCTSTYPADPGNSNILTIPDMKQQFNCEIGLSDHTLGIGASIAAVAHGAVVIEKHFTLDRSEGGIDSTFSMEPEEMRLLVENSLIAWKSLGSVSYGPSKNEKASILNRRSLYIVENMEAGDTLTEQNMRAIRPGHGLPPKYYQELLNRKVNRKVKRGTPVSWDLVS